MMLWLYFGIWVSLGICWIGVWFVDKYDGEEEGFGGFGGYCCLVVISTALWAFVFSPMMLNEIGYRKAGAIYVGVEISLLLLAILIPMVVMPLYRAFVNWRASR